ncbi:MAG: acylphosphatase [Gammaproteobacteria bacterium]|nr:acylphosphatase [Gammaproteobacteria bacterium]
METRQRVIISGRVQGVSYRYWTRQEATARGLRGYVRNLSDGRVEAVFGGDEADIIAMVDACWQGPDAARVSGIEQAAFEGGFPDTFEIRPSARA